MPEFIAELAQQIMLGDTDAMYALARKQTHYCVPHAWVPGPMVIIFIGWFPL